MERKPTDDLEEKNAITDNLEKQKTENIKTKGVVVKLDEQTIKETENAVKPVKKKYVLSEEEKQKRRERLALVRPKKFGGLAEEKEMINAYINDKKDEIYEKAKKQLEKEEKKLLKKTKKDIINERLTKKEAIQQEPIQMVIEEPPVEEPVKQTRKRQSVAKPKELNSTKAIQNRSQPQKSSYQPVQQTSYYQPPQPLFTFRR